SSLILIGKGKSATRSPCICPISLWCRRNSIPPNLCGSEVTSVQLSISFAIRSMIATIDIILLIYIYKVLGLQTIQIILYLHSSDIILDNDEALKVPSLAQS